MTSIHDPEQSSGEGSKELANAQAQCAALARRKDELEVVIAASRLGICRVDPQSWALNANSQFKAEFGWPPDGEPVWSELQERIAPEDRRSFDDAVRNTLSGGPDFEIRLRSNWPDGTSQWLALHGRAVNDGGSQLSLFLTSRNVSDERHTADEQASEQAAAVEHERRLRSEAQAANRGKDQFLAVFSHELRSPLNAILGWNRILALKRTEDADVASITARIEHSARAQLKIINDLLDLGRIETGKLRIEARPLQLAKVVSAAIDVARPVAAAKGVTLSAEFEQGSGQVRGDPDRLQQVVTNLLSNAVKFTPAGGQVGIALRNLGGFTELRVQDTGVGIGAELLPHIFDRFRQGDSSSTRQAGGLGLGLTLVREIVTLHGGTISAHSAGKGSGSTFIASFPTRQPWQASAPQPSTDPPLGTAGTTLDGLSILVVDDEPDARTVVAETLKLEGARVTAADSAMSAFEKLQEEGAHFDILVTDIGMPEEDGYSLVRRLRASQPGRRMLAIAVTGYASTSDVNAAMDAGFDLHVPKPVDFNTFVPLVRRLAGEIR